MGILFAVSLPFSIPSLSPFLLFTPILLGISDEEERGEWQREPLVNHAGVLPCKIHTRTDGLKERGREGGRKRGEEGRSEGARFERRQKNRQRVCSPLVDVDTRYQSQWVINVEGSLPFALTSGSIRSSRLPHALEAPRATIGHTVDIGTTV